MKLSESWLLPLAGISLFLGCIGFIIAATVTRDWLYLVGAFICFTLIAAK